MLSVPRFSRCQSVSSQRRPATTTPLFRTISFPGDHTGRATPVPIPNTAVKPARADDTLTGKVGRCLDFFRPPRSYERGGLFCWSSGEASTFAVGRHPPLCMTGGTDEALSRKEILPPRQLAR